ncbi:aromatic ring-hydroxylating oxygenase subunit alpha [Nocardia sp. CWNU-33]|uniref:aromatic ring-hydroxylating oxygenase subunit alpha n=1 Tax=Nocardia sp. CWNU-33 TaxID=3392117 RepID=UPI00398E3B49
MTATVDPHAELNSLLDRVEEGMQENLVPIEIFSNDAIFDAEMRRIFARCWVFVAHESEIPSPGDYVLRRIGLDPVIVARDESGSVNVLSNYCRHRATMVCQVDQGNASHFRCPYHGWIYKNNGDWLGAPHRNRAYRKLDPKQWGLLRAPHVDSIHGLIFASLSPDAPTLRDFLGEATVWMLDALFGLHPDGMRVMAPPDRMRVRTDWKSAAENAGGDTYHADTTHISLDDIGLAAKLPQLNDHARHYDLGSGNTFIGHGFVDWLGSDFWYWGYPRELTSQFVTSGLDDAQRSMLDSHPPITGTLFPNFSYLRFPGSPDPETKPLAVYTSIRLWQPIAPGVQELWNWQLSWNCSPKEYSEACYDAGQNAFGSSGVFEQDDTVVWEGLPQAARSVFAQKNHMMANYQLATEGMSEQSKDANWQGPGISRITGFGECNQMSFYRRWLKEMRQPGQQ